MTNYREIPRLSSLGIAKKNIAASCGCSRNTVTNVLQRAAVSQISWPLPDDMTNKDANKKQH
ncbi:MAG: hypothetical protein ACOY35_06785 [Bacillota bacterium]